MNIHINYQQYENKMKRLCYLSQKFFKMKTPVHKLLRVIFFLAILLITSESCRRSVADKSKCLSVNPAFREYVEGFTAGHISTESDIIVRLNFDAADSLMIASEADETLLKFKPSIKGKAIWSDARTFRFQPEKKLPSETFFEAEFDLSKLISVPDSLKKMIFGFETIAQDFEVLIEKSRAYKADDLSLEYLAGVVLTADVEELSVISKLISAYQEGNALEVSWTQDADKRKHYFKVDNITRENKETEVAIKYNGSPVGIDKTGILKHTIPGLNEFKVTAVETKRFPESIITVRFSDPISEDQDFDGKITLGKFFNYSYSVSFNELHIYPASELSQEEFLTLSSGIVNTSGKTLTQPYSERLIFNDIAPDIHFLSTGTILPSSNGQVIPFEAINLKAVDVRIIKIYQQNIPQFLQVNEISGNSQISRVGKTVLKKTLPLGKVANTNTWNKYFLDISDMIQTEPGAIYQVQLSMKKEYSTLPCDDTDTEEDDVFSFYNTAVEDNETEWEYYYDYDEYYYDDYYYYSWYERNDPCSKSYFYEKKVSTNIFATDIGLMAKAGDNGEFFVIATDLVTAQPINNVKIELLSYQLQSMGNGVTDENGTCKIQAGKKPYLVFATKDKQQSYLRISDGNALSLSSFDVSGESVQKGLKGFIYGERGVWRPGDSVFVTLIIEDKNTTLPENHPVIFELYNPLGNLIEKRPVTTSLNGFYAFHTATSPDAPTGTYRLYAKVGKNTFTHLLKIETIKPNRLKIEFDPGKTPVSLSVPSEMKIHSQWLHGATAKNLRVESDVYYKSTMTSFPKFKGFIFDDPTKQFTSDRFSLYSGKLDENGTTIFKPDLKIEQAPGFINAFIETRVYEPGGEFSIDFSTVSISPFKSYAGILKPKQSDDSPYFYTNRKYNFAIGNVMENGAPVSNGIISIEVFKLDWQYWWSSYENDYSDFMYSSGSTPVVSQKINIQNGLGTFAFQVENDEWGKYFIKLTDSQSGHTSGLIAYFDWFGYNRFAENDKTSAAMLSISTDKSKYTVGEEIRLSFKAPVKSRAYITVENSSGVAETYQLNEKNNLIEFSTKATAEMAPNVYISVSLLQPHSNTIDGLPIRLYGIVPVFIENPETKLSPVINAPSQMHPGQVASVKVSESSGKPMTYTLAIVDEGLLNLTKFKTPDPHSRFYSREALGVRTWDLYNDVIGAWGGQIQRILSIGGGDEAEIDASGQRANRFKPMVRFIGPVELGKEKTNTHQITIPDYVGSVRIMVVAGQNSAYGNAQKSVPVRNPLMLLGTAPRVIGPGESFKVPVSVFATEKHVKNVNISVKTNALFTVSGSKSSVLKFTTTGEQLAGFELKAADAIGMGQIIISAVSGNEKAVWKIEIDVRPSNPEITDIIETSVAKGETWNMDIQPLGVSGTNSNTLEITSFIPMNIDKWLSYLLNYPHGCSEQTISGAFPMLYAAELSQTSVSANKKAEVKIKNAISRIQSQQLGSGGIAMWPGARYEDDWTTSYAGHFLIEAQQKGYVVSKQCISRWKNYQQRKARNWKHDRSMYNNDLMQAYRLYSLALAGSPETGAMNRLSELSYLSPQSKWLLAASYAISGRPDVAKQMTAKTTTSIMPYYEYAYTYGSNLRDKAFILETYLRLGMKNNALTILKEIAEELKNNQWLSTQTAAQCLRAVALYLKEFPMGKQMNFSIAHNKTTKDYGTKNMTHSMDLGTGKQNGISVTNKSSGTLYVRIIRRGIPKETDVPAVQNNLTLKVTYTGLDGKPINPEIIEQGTIFYSTVTITHPGIMNAYKSMALTQIFPSGWEILSDRYINENEDDNDFTYQDIRDDRVLTYFNLPQAKSITVKVRLSASYAGTFYLPMIWCEAMYNNKVNASLPGKWVKVVAPDEKPVADAGNR